MKTLMILITLLMILGCSSNQEGRLNDNSLVDSLAVIVAYQQGYIRGIEGFFKNGEFNYSDSFALSFGFTDTILFRSFKEGMAHSQFFILSVLTKEGLLDETYTFDDSF